MPGERLVYLTDVEGRWDKLVDFTFDSSAISLTSGGRIELAPEVLFVFGGDAVDRGPDARRFVRALLELKSREPSRVVLLAGNRDINKLRLTRELQGFAPTRAPEALKSEGGPRLLRWIFEHTMGAREAFGHRQRELATEGSDSSDSAVVQSFLDDLKPDGDLRRYLALCQLGWRWRETLFLHGGITLDNQGVVPLREERSLRPDAWVRDLNDFYRAQMESFARGTLSDEGAPAWSPLVEYQAPIRGTRLNQRSVVYARPSSDNLPRLPARSVVEWLRTDGIERLVLGHTPSGDFPAVLRGGGLEVVLADNSYAKVERGSRVTLEGRALTVEGWTRLASDHVEPVCFQTSLDDRHELIGRYDPATGHLVKGRLRRGGYVLFAFRDGFRVDQLIEAPEALRRRALAEPPEDLSTQPPAVIAAPATDTPTAEAPRDGHVFLLATRPETVPADACVALDALTATLASLRAERADARITVAIPVMAPHDADRVLREVYAALDGDRRADAVLIAADDAVLAALRAARRGCLGAMALRRSYAALDADAVEAFRAKKVSIFAGFGLSLAAGLPDWHALTDTLAGALGVTLSAARDEPESLLDLASWYRHASAHPTSPLRIVRELVRSLYGRAQTAGVKPSVAHHLLASLGARTVFSVGFDPLLERAYEARGVSVEAVDDLDDADASGTRVVKLFGDAEHGRHLVLSREDYAAPFAARPALDAALQDLAAGGRAAFVGYARKEVPLMRVERRLREANPALKLIVAPYENGAVDEPARSLARWLDALTDALAEI